MELLTLIKREYSERVRSRSFIFATIFGLLLIFGFSFAPAITDKIRQGDKVQAVVLERAPGEITDYLQEHLQDQLPNGEKQFSFLLVPAEDSTWAALREAQLNSLIEGGISAFLEVLPPDAEADFIWHIKNIDLGGATIKVESALQQKKTQERIADSGLTKEQISEVFAPITLVRQVDGLKADSEEQQAQNMVLVYFMLFILYFSLAFYGMQVANGVVEEKSSRVMEMMISTIKPSSMMAGKIVGVGAVGLTQYFLWIGAGLGLMGLRGSGIPLLGQNQRVAAIEPLYLLYFVVFFMLGFLLYSSMYAAIGAMVSRPEDTGQAVSMMTFLIVGAFAVSVFSLYRPDNVWVVILSYVPFFTPMVLFARIILSDVSTAGVVFGVLDLLLAVFLLIWISGKIYRIGVLLYGKVSWRSMFRMMRGNR